MVTQTPNHSLDKPEDSDDGPVWADAIESTIDKVDEKLILRGTLANRPVAGTQDRFFFATDKHILYRDTGAEWVVELSAIGPTVTKSDDYTAEPGEVVLVDASAAAVTITLPAPEDSARVVVKKIDSSGNSVTVATPNTETIDGASSDSISTQWKGKAYSANAADYYVTGSF